MNPFDVAAAAIRFAEAHKERIAYCGGDCYQDMGQCTYCHREVVAWREVSDLLPAVVKP